MEIRQALGPLKWLNRDIEETIDLISGRQVDHWVNQPEDQIQQAILRLFEQCGLKRGVESVIIPVVINHDVADSSANWKAFLFEKI